MPDVLQRLLVHLLVLDDREHRLRAIEQRMPRPLELGRRERVFERGDPIPRRTRSPARATATSARSESPGTSCSGSMPRAKSTSSAGSMPGSPERLLEQRVHAEGGQVPLVEHDRIAQRDRPAVVRLGRNQVEQLPRSGTHATETVEQRRAIDRRAGGNRCRSRHSGSSAHRRVACRLDAPRRLGGFSRACSVV